MPLTPQISLIVTLQDIQGNGIGSVGSPAYVEIALAGYGATLPRIAGAAMLASVGPQTQKLPYQGSPITVQLWGNDVITPGGTHYVISLLDDQQNVIQSAAYVLNGSLAGDLSDQPQFFPSATSSVRGSEVALQATATPNFDCGLVNGPVEFYLLLTKNVSSATLLPNFAGQIVMFRIQQDPTGGWSFAWPSNVSNPGIIGGAAGQVTSQAFVVGSNGTAYPLGPQTYS